MIQDSNYPDKDESSQQIFQDSVIKHRPGQNIPCLTEMNVKSEILCIFMAEFLRIALSI